MDAYHQVLVKLYETTGGRDTYPVDFKELVKSLGFHGNYADIFERLSSEGWIAEDKKPDFVRLTHWGAKEVKNPSASTPDLKHRTLVADAGNAATAAKELSLLLEIFAQNTSPENLTDVQGKIGEINVLLERIKSNVG